MKTKRGRGKHRPYDYDTNEIKRILKDKIDEENKAIIGNNNINLKTTYGPSKASIANLFCGAGGLSLGFELAGLDIKLDKEVTDICLQKKDDYNSIRHKSIFHHAYSNDSSKEAVETHRANFPNTVVHHSNIKKIKQFPYTDVVLGGFPCPGFSTAGPRLIDDPRNFLYIHFIRCLMMVCPMFFVAENVKGILSLGKGEVFRQIKQDFQASGYKVYHKLVNSKDYGVPQSRERVFLVGVREDIEYEYEFPRPTHGEGLKPYVTLEDAIGDLRGNPGEYYTGSYSSIYMSRNRKKDWNDQSFTIQASGRQAPIHPSGKPMKKLDKDKWVFGGGSNRRLSIDEIARIQTFPDWYEFSQGDMSKISKNGRLDKAYKQIGNAVPVELARAIALPIAKWFANVYAIPS